MTVTDILTSGGRHPERVKDFPVTLEQKQAAAKLARAVSYIEMVYGKTLVVSSGYRPASVQAKVNPKVKNSKHSTCEAVDVVDKSGAFGAWLLTAAGLAALGEVGLHIEDPNYTEGWVHLQSVPPRSGKRVFVP